VGIMEGLSDVFVSRRRNRSRGLTRPVRPIDRVSGLNRRPGGRHLQRDLDDAFSRTELDSVPVLVLEGANRALDDLAFLIRQRSPGTIRGVAHAVSGRYGPITTLVAPPPAGCGGQQKQN